MTNLKIPLFQIPNLFKGTFISRLDRFVGEVIYKERISSSFHIHDPGRLKELLLKGAEVLFTNSRGKLQYYIKAVKKNDIVIHLAAITGAIDSFNSPDIYAKVNYEGTKNLIEVCLERELTD